MNSILPPLKAIADTHASEAEQAAPAATRELAQPQPVHPVPAQSQPPAPYAPSYSPPASQMSNMSVSEKAAHHNQYASPPPQAPPAYPQVPAVSMATALYTYKTSDPGDLAFEPQHRIQITQELNNDCMISPCPWVQTRLTSVKQGGVVATRLLAKRVFSPQATWLESQRKWLLTKRLNLPTMATYPCKSARVGSPPIPRTPKTRSRTSLRKEVKSSERNWEMPVCLTPISCVSLHGF